MPSTEGGIMKTRWSRGPWGLLAATMLMPDVFLNAQTTNTNSSPIPNDRTLGTVERTEKVIGREVRNASNQRIGKIEDLIVDLESGRLLYAVVSAGGFLGVGDRLIAVPPPAFSDQGRRLQTNADKERLSQAPQFSKDKDNTEKMLSPAFVSQAYKFFGQSAWWEDASGKMSERFGNAHKVSDLRGMDVRNISNEIIGKVSEVTVSLAAGRVPYVILAPDQRLDLKSKLFALPPNALTLSADKKYLTTGIDGQQLASAPGFDKDNWSDLSNPAFAARVYQHYGKQPYFDGGTLRPTSVDRNLPERIYHEPAKTNQ